MRNRAVFNDRNKKMFDPLRKSCPMFHPCISTVTKAVLSQAEFNYDYSQFTRDLPITQEVKDNLKYLFELYSKICEAGGLVYVIANNLLEAIISKMSIKFPQLKNLTPQNIVQHYIKFELFSYEIVLKTGKRISNDKLMSLHLPKFISEAELKGCLIDIQKGLQLYNQDIVVLSSLCSTLNIDESIFNLAKIFEAHEGEILKIFVQDIDEKDYIAGKTETKASEMKNICENIQKCSLNLGISTLCKLVSQGNFSSQKRDLNELQLTLKQFNTYFNLCSNSYEENSQFLKSKFVRGIGQKEKQKKLYAFQFDPKDEYLTGEIHKRIKDTFLCYKQKYDLLSYADEDIIGVTFPKFQIQLEGNWQGGTQQPFGISKVNISFGPDPNEWYCVSGDNLNKFHAVIRTQYGVSAQKIEGQWFEDIDWFLERKIPIKKVVQKKGEGVIIGNGSMFWQKSKGKSLHASWNFMGKSEKPIVAAINKYTKIRQIQNQSCPTPISNRWQKKIPLKAIFLRVLNHEQYYSENKTRNEGEISMSCLVMVRQWLKKWWTEEQKFLNQLIVRQDITNCRYKYYYLFDAESYCSYCENEILNYFLNNNGLSCLECASKSFVSKRAMQLKDRNIYFKYESFWVTQLIYYGSTRTLQKTEPYLQYEQVCKGQFIGSIENCSRALRKHMENQPAETIESQYDWQNFLHNLNEEESNSLEVLFQKKVQSLINKARNFNPNQNMLQSLPKNFIIQTNLSLLCEPTDKDIQTFVSTAKKGRNLAEPTKQTVPYSGPGSAYVSQQSVKRKEKRNMLKKTIDQRNDTQCSDELYDGRFAGSRRKDNMKQRNTYRSYEDRIKQNSNMSTRSYPVRFSRDEEEAEIRAIKRSRQRQIQRSRQRSDSRERMNRQRYMPRSHYDEERGRQKPRQNFTSREKQSYDRYKSDGRSRYRN